MARLNNTIAQEYQDMEMKDLHKPIIFVVDMIQGFIHQGALHDEAIHEITPSLLELLTKTTCRKIFFVDAHPHKAREFSSYPVHCLEGTIESEVIDELKPHANECYKKNCTNAFHAPFFQSFLKELNNYQDIVITGCCTDICILQFALSLQSWLNEHNYVKQRIIVPIDMVETYHIEHIHDAKKENEFALRNMKANGIEVISTLKRGN